MGRSDKRFEKGRIKNFPTQTPGRIKEVGSHQGTSSPSKKDLDTPLGLRNGTYRASDQIEDRQMRI